MLHIIIKFLMGTFNYVTIWKERGGVGRVGSIDMLRILFLIKRYVEFIEVEAGKFLKGMTYITCFVRFLLKVVR